MKRTSNKVLSIMIASIFLVACIPKNGMSNFQEEEVVSALILRYNDSVYKSSMRISTLSWLLEIDDDNNHHNQYIETWSGNSKDTIILSEEGRNRINRFIVPDSTFHFIGNDPNELLNHYFILNELTNSYYFAFDSIDEDSPYNIQIAIMYKMIEYGYKIVKDEETGFFFLDNSTCQ